MSEKAKWRVFDGKRFVKAIRARDYDRACRAADALGARHGLKGPMIAIPVDERVRVKADCD